MNEEQMKAAVEELKSKVDAVAADVSAVKALCEKWEKEQGTTEGDDAPAPESEAEKALKAEVARLKSLNDELVAALKEVTESLEAA